MIGISDSSVAIQVSLQFVPSTPAWFGEMALIAHYLLKSRYILPVAASDITR